MSGEAVRVIARDPSRLDPQVRERVEVVAGSHDDPSVVTEAFAGADTVFWLVPPDFHAESVEGHYLSFTRPACAGDTEPGCKACGRGHEPRPRLREGRRAAIGRVHDGRVDREHGCGLPGSRDAVFHGEPHQPGRGYQGTRACSFMTNSADRPLATVATRDIATTAAGLVLDGSWSGQKEVPVVGPDDLSPDDMAQVMSEVLEREIRFQRVGGEDYKATMIGYGASEAWAQGMADMTAAQNDGIYNAEMRAAERSPTSFRRWCEEVLKPTVTA